VWIVAPVAAFVLLAGACGSSGTETTTASTVSPSSVETTTTTAPPTTTTATAVAPAPSGAKPTCAEVDAFIAQLSPSDRAMLARAEFMYVGRGPSGGDTWRVYTQVDVTKPALTPEIAVYYDWSPATGLSSPVVVTSFAERDALVDLGTVNVVVGMQCRE